MQPIPQTERQKMRRQAYLLGVVALIAAFLGAYLVAAGALPTQYNLTPGEAVPGIRVLEPYEMTVLIDELAAPRFLLAHPTAPVLFVSERGAGRVIALQDADDNRAADGIIVTAANLALPSGLAYHEDWLYIAEAAQIIRVRLDENFQETQREVVVSALPIGRNPDEVESNQHALLIHHDELYVTVGASCAACQETDSRRAAVLVYDLDGSNERIFASGLYESLGLAANPVTGELWASSQGRPQLDDPAPEAIYRLENGDNAGWAGCIAGERIDPDMGQADSCAGVIKPLITLEPQANITTIQFYDHPSAPDELRGGLFAVLHGGAIADGRDGIQVGFVVLHLPIDPNTGAINGDPQTFIDGFFLSKEPGDFLGRPFGLSITPDGRMYISDDAAGAIYEVRLKGV